MRNFTPFFFSCLIFSLLGRLSSLAHPVAAEMADAAKNFLAALSTEQRAKASYEFKDGERFDWHFIPKPRKGLPLGEMSPSQRALAEALLSSGLSHQGFAKASIIMSLEQVLYDLENKSAMRNAELYYFTVFGRPGPEPWGWRVEGHHLSLNFSVQGDDVLAFTPSFFGANPARIMEGPREGLRPYAAEEDLGRELARSLDPEQAKAGIISTEAPRDIITGNSRKAKALEPMGISSQALKPEQKKLLFDLVQEYRSRYTKEVVENEAKKSGPDGQLWFAWAGSIEPGKGHYYRIQSETFLIEFDNTQNNANHVHTVWRDLKNDFGEDTLRAHYDKVPHEK